MKAYDKRLDNALNELEQMLRDHRTIDDSPDLGQMCHDALDHLEHIEPNWLDSSFSRISSLFRYMANLFEGRLVRMREVYEKRTEAAKSARLRKACVKAIDIANDIVDAAERRSAEVHMYRETSMKGILRLAYIRRLLIQETTELNEDIRQTPIGCEIPEDIKPRDEMLADPSPEDQDSTETSEEYSYDRFNKVLEKRSRIERNNHDLRLIKSVLPAYVAMAGLIQEQYDKADRHARQALQYRAMLRILAMERTYAQVLPGSNKTIDYLKRIATAINEGAGDKKLLMAGLPEDQNEFEELIGQIDQRRQDRAIATEETSRDSGRILDALEPYRKEGEE